MTTSTPDHSRVDYKQVEYDPVALARTFESSGFKQDMLAASSAMLTLRKLDTKYADNPHLQAKIFDVADTTENDRDVEPLQRHIEELRADLAAQGITTEQGIEGEIRSLFNNDALEAEINDLVRRTEEPVQSLPANIAQRQTDLSNLMTRIKLVGIRLNPETSRPIADQRFRDMLLDFADDIYDHPEDNQRSLEKVVAQVMRIEELIKQGNSPNDWSNTSSLSASEIELVSEMKQIVSTTGMPISYIHTGLNDLLAMLEGFKVTIERDEVVIQDDLITKRAAKQILDVELEHKLVAYSEKVAAQQTATGVLIQWLNGSAPKTAAAQEVLQVSQQAITGELYTATADMFGDQHDPRRIARQIGEIANHTMPKRVKPVVPEVIPVTIIEAEPIDDNGASLPPAPISVMQIAKLLAVHHSNHSAPVLADGPVLKGEAPVNEPYLDVISENGMIETSPNVVEVLRPTCVGKLVAKLEQGEKVEIAGELQQEIVNGSVAQEAVELLKFAQQVSRGSRGVINPRSWLEGIKRHNDGQYTTSEEALESLEPFKQGVFKAIVDFMQGKQLDINDVNYGRKSVAIGLVNNPGQANRLRHELHLYARKNASSVDETLVASFFGINAVQIIRR
jgi:hypothetical protein